MSEQPVRPSQTSLCGWLVVLGSVFVVLASFERVASLGSIESQEAAADALDRAPTAGLGLSVDDVQVAMHVMGVVAGGLATLTGCAGWLVLRRSRQARVVLSVAAPLLVLTGVAVSPFASMIVAAATLMLWLQPSRAWFAGLPAPAPAGASSGSTGASGSSGPAPDPVRAPTSSGAPAPPPPPPAPHGTMSAMTESYPPPPQYGSTTPYGSSGAPTKRPGTVTAAAIITMVFGTLTLIGCGLTGLALLLVDSNDAVDELQKQLDGEGVFEDYTYEDFENLLSIAGIIFLVLAVWALISIVLAVGAMRGSNGARIALVASAAVSIVVSLVGTLGLLFPGLNLIAAIAVIVLLFTGGASEWYRSRKTARV